MPSLILTISKPPNKVKFIVDVSVENISSIIAKKYKAPHQDTLTLFMIITGGVNVYPAEIEGAVSDSSESG